MSNPLVKGGQGHSEGDVTFKAMIVALCLGIALGILAVAFLIPVH